MTKELCISECREDLVVIHGGLEIGLTRDWKRKKKRMEDRLSRRVTKANIKKDISDERGNKILRRAMRRSSYPWNDSVLVMEDAYRRARKLGKKAEKKENKAAETYRRYKKYFENNDIKMTPELEERSQKLYDYVMERHNMRLLLNERIK